MADLDFVKFPDQAFVEISITLDTKIDIAQRVVKDAIALFGDIGGFSGFFLTLLGIFVGSIPSKLFAMNSASSLFRANPKSKKRKNTQPNNSD